jgi:signal transduction histidine kinase
MEKLFELGTTRDEFKMVRTDGTTFDGEITSTVMTDSKGNPTGLIAVTRDITERKQAEVERERFTTQLQTAADIATQASTLLDPQELLEEAVALLKERFDLYHVHVYTLDEEGGELVMQAGSGSAGRAMREQGHTIPLDREESYVATAARTQQAVVVNDVRETPGFMPNPLLPDTVSEVAIPLTIGDQVLGVFDVQDDERDRFTELEMNVFRTLTGQLASALQNALYFEEIQETTERLREVDRLKSEFLANMSHELRTPLNSIIGYSEVMMMGIDGELDPETMEDVKAIYENGQHLLNMINDILDLAKIEAGRMSLNVEPVDLHLLLEELKTTNQGLIHKAKKPIEMKVTVDQSVQTVPADRIRLNQILTNLVGNAIKFTEKGHVHLKAYQHGRHWVCIDVEDTGAGISQDQLEEIFEKFRQADGSAKRQAEGTGLGLAITRSLAQLHGGRIEVDSEPGKGSTFTVWLPAQHNGRDN